MYTACVAEEPTYTMSSQGSTAFGDREGKWVVLQVSVFITPLHQGQKDDTKERQKFSFHHSRKRAKDLVGGLSLASHLFRYDVMLCFKTWENGFSLNFFVLNRH